MPASEKPFGGFTGRVLRVDLGAGRTTVEEPDEILYRRYGGGAGLATYFLLRELPVGVDPLGPENVMVFMTGAMSGTPLWGANRFVVVAKSPLTLGFGRSEAGGWWGPELKAAGFDGIILTGRSPQPVYLWIHDGEAEIRPADDLWGRVTGEVHDTILEQTGDRRTRVLQCGPAAERGVRFAALTNELRHWNGRCGMGAVMAAKNLRAIAVRGTGKVGMVNEERARGILRSLRTSYNRNESTMHLHGTARGVPGLNEDGILPTRNFRDGYFDQADNISGQTMSDTILVGRGTCYACAVACKREVEVPALGVSPKYGGPEYETVGSLGSLCGVGSLAHIAKGNQLCGEYGLDTISTGVAIAFAMECYENELLTQADTGGLDLRFGNAEAMLEMIHRIGRRQGLGDLLAEGVGRAALHIPGSQRYAMHVKNQEVPMHEPRGKKGLALSYALSPTGADHVEAPHDPFLETVGMRGSDLEPLGLYEPLDRMDFSFRKVRAYYLLQLLWGTYNVIGMCNFAATPIGPIKLPDLVDYYGAVTGWAVSLWELLRLAERASAMYRMFNVREGFGVEEDRLPQRFFEPLGNGSLKGERMDAVEFEEARRLFYQLAGWDERTGVPTRARLLELDLEWLL
ncbi:MAG: aldehyde ferredoxin oxidoreductase family protein [Anaerolineae bacterium]|nr:aldehyde ferredoxin oxidoreductase family protein [Anaerolineae bacterium]